ncbi:hypothetical protein [Anabaena azotica]|uniref:Uncharacterized protein n=1 Tax=Anabaena azotica FACHB-119 TaxID=947527 RepID=A0ABR8D4J5_9NOST|nr:hypothetical protein [Anabaena azotica]MBD2501215.1 hypothetical protein [Anabaena azotica FACHB-119]
MTYISKRFLGGNIMLLVKTQIFYREAIAHPCLISCTVTFHLKMKDFVGWTVHRHLLIDKVQDVSYIISSIPVLKILVSSAMISQNIVKNIT